MRAVILSLTLMAPLALAQQTAERDRADRRVNQEGGAVSDLRNAEGKVIGTATFKQEAKGVRMRLEVSSLPEGELALHIHETGACEPPTFESAGPHFNPMHKKHGVENPAGPHLGDLHNLKVAANGMAKVERVIDSATLAEGENSLLRAGGTAVVIHAKADDYKTDPAGAAGDRIACGVITRQ